MLKTRLNQKKGYCKERYHPRHGIFERIYRPLIRDKKLWAMKNIKTILYKLSVHVHYMVKPALKGDRPCL
jgi:hypothetical protein